MIGSFVCVSECVDSGRSATMRDELIVSDSIRQAGGFDEVGSRGSNGSTVVEC
jgi:hypothetical protein